MAEHVIRPAARTQGMTYAIRDILIEANKARAAGKELLFLNIGDPNKFDFDTPRYILDAVKDALDSDRNGYAPSDGYPESLEAIRGWAADKGIRDIQDVFIGPRGQ